MTAVSTALCPARRGDGRHRFSALIYDRLQRNHQQMNRQLAAQAAFMILALITAAPVALAADGAKVSAEFCVVCHGEKGAGNTRLRRGLTTPPRDFTRAAARRDLSPERMINSVTPGRPGPALMSFRKRLSADEIETVVDYIRASFFMKGPAPAAPHPQFV